MAFASPNVLAMLAAMVLPPFSIRLNEMLKTMPSVIASAIVSPSARPRPSITAAITPGLPYGSTAVRTISHLVAPSASAASSFMPGVCRKTSRDNDVMIGSTMIARTRLPSMTERPNGPSPPNSGIQPK